MVKILSPKTHGPPGGANLIDTDKGHKAQYSANLKSNNMNTTTEVTQITIVNKTCIVPSNLTGKQLKRWYLKQKREQKK